jgi:hypothetical protein
MTSAAIRGVFSRKISDFCRKRISAVLPPQVAERVRIYMLELIKRGDAPPRKHGKFDWAAIAESCSMDLQNLLLGESAIRPRLEAVLRKMKGKLRKARIEQVVVSPPTTDKEP